MILIAHRGNINGPNPELENNPEYVEVAVNKGYDVEVDVWLINSVWMLGHDGPSYEAEEDFLLTDGLWCHAKNIAALERLNVMGAHVFWHQEDDVALTSRGFLWTFPGKPLTPHSICVMPERANYETIDCVGICTDFVKRYDSRDRPTN